MWVSFGVALKLMDEGRLSNGESVGYKLQSVKEENFDLPNCRHGYIMRGTKN